MPEASGVMDLVSKLTPVLVDSVDSAMGSAGSSRLVSRTLLDAGDMDENMRDLILSSIPPLIAGIVLAVCVMVGYLLFLLVSGCCKFCSSKRGCCQRPQELTYKQRLPFIIMVAVPALLGLIGGIVVLASGPGLVKAIKALFDGLLEQLNIIIDLIQSLYDDGVRASELADTDSSSLDPLQELLDSMKSARDTEIADFNEQATAIFKLISTISMLVGGGMMATGILGVVGPATLKNFLLVGFLFHAAILTSLPFVIWGALTFVGSVGDHICTEIDILATGQASSLLTMETCPDPQDISDKLDGPVESTNTATESLNDLLMEANDAAATAISTLQTECSNFDGTGSTYYDALCSTGSSVDAQLMTSIYQCVDAANEGIATFSISGAIQNTDDSCPWHEANYPSVDFGVDGSAASIEACFRTATETINSDDGTFRGMVSAATTEGASFLQEDDFVRGILMTLPLACSFNDVSGSMEYTGISVAPTMPPLCPPFNLTGTLPVPMTAEECEAAGQTAFENFNTTFEAFKCSPDVVTLSGDDEEVNRKRCTIAGRPIFVEDFDTMANNAEAVTLFQRMLTNLNLWASCQILFGVLLSIQSNCHPIPQAAKKLATGMLICGIGFTLAALFVCSCWRKINKPKKNAVEPYNEFK